jgi:hypothetical protein
MMNQKTLFPLTFWKPGLLDTTLVCYPSSKKNKVTPSFRTTCLKKAKPLNFIVFLDSSEIKKPVKKRALID